MKISIPNLYKLEEAMGYEFQNKALLEQALTHPSLKLESDYQRLEFLGDSLLGFIVADELYKTAPTMKEGQMTRQRSTVVRKESLARMSERLELSQYIQTGNGEEGNSRPSILADVFEAIVAAIYLDGGIVEARKFVLSCTGSVVDFTCVNCFIEDYKSALQELAQKNFGVTATYELLDSYGFSHDKTFESGVYIDGKCYGKGVGKNKKRSEQEAARVAYMTLTNEGTES